MDVLSAMLIAAVILLLLYTLVYSISFVGSVFGIPPELQPYLSLVMFAVFAFAVSVIVAPFVYKRRR